MRNLIDIDSIRASVRPMKKILGICGSLRQNSYNKKLLLTAGEILRATQCEFTYLDLKSLQLPIFDEDIEAELKSCEGAEKLVDMMNSCDAIVFASPEYNGSISAALKNAIDWASRAEKNPFNEKPILIMGTSMGWFAASKAMIHLRLILSHLQGIVIPAQVTVPNAEKAFDSNGALVHETSLKNLKTACAQLLRIVN